MKEFFYQLLQQLDKLTGIKQYDKLMALPEQEADKELEELLRILCKTCGMFPLIPRDAQKSIITHSIVADGEFIGLNAKIVYKWLAAHKDKYFQESHHVPSEPLPDWKPVEGEARQKWLKEWEKTLLETQGGMTTQSHVKELEQTLPKKPAGSYTPSASPEVAEMSRLKVEYARECRDRDTGKLLPGKPEFKDWIENKK